MKTKHPTHNPNIQRNQLSNDELYNRRMLARSLNVGHIHKNFNAILNYPQDIEFKDYFSKYERQDLAYAIIERPIAYTWKGGVSITNPNVKTDTMQDTWKKLYDRLKLSVHFRTLDKLASIGKYAVMLLGFDDVQTTSDFEKEVKKGSRELLYVQVYSQVDAKVIDYDRNVNSERYGLPTIYQIQTKIENTTISFRVHHSRIIHVVGEILTSFVEGKPVLEKVYNRLLDVEKITGGSAEMFWRGARPGYQGVVDKDYQIDTILESDLKSKINDYENDLSRVIMAEGFELKSLNSQVENPVNHLEAQINLISAATAIPKRILLGSERGELSSSQDATAWADVISDRRLYIAEMQIITPFIDICKRYNILPDEDYIIEWETLYDISEKDKAEVARMKSEALRAYASSPLASEIIPPEAFLKLLMGFTAEQVQEVLSMIEADAFKLPEELKELEELEENNINEEI